MSSASPSSQVSTTRNPRRRQRNSTEDLPTRQQQPQRKRHKAAGDGFKSVAAGHNGDGGTYMNGHTLPKQNEAVLVGDVPIRGKQPGNRALKDEGGVVLVSEAFPSSSLVTNIYEDTKYELQRETIAQLARQYPPKQTR